MPVVMTATDVIKHSANQLVNILKDELEFEKKALKEKLHKRTLERIFIEERIYKSIEEMKTQEEEYAMSIRKYIPTQHCKATKLQ